MHTLTPEQALVLEAIKSLRQVATLPPHSPFKAEADEMQKALFLILARQIGTSIIIKELE